MEIKLGVATVAIQIHSGFFRIPSRKTERFDRPNWHMFVQDLVARIAPSSFLQSDDEKGEFVLVGEPTHVEGAQERLSEISQIIGSDRRAGVEGLIGRAAERLPWTGRVMMDLREIPRGTMQEHRSRECYDWIMPRLGKYVIQIGFELTRHRWALHIGIVPRAEVLDFKIPRQLGGLWRYRMLIRKIDRFSAIGPRYWMKLLETEGGGAPEVAVDHSNYRRRVSAYRDRLLREWGWNGRDSSTEYKTEYFSVFRFLKMHRACALVRQSILEEIESFLARDGNRARVSAGGFRSAAEIEQVIERLAAGTISLGDAYKAIGIP